MELIGTLLWLLALVAFIWVVFEVWTKQKGMTTGIKVLWTVLAFFFNIITAIVYFFMYKK